MITDKEIEAWKQIMGKRPRGKYRLLIKSRGHHKYKGDDSFRKKYPRKKHKFCKVGSDEWIKRLEEKIEQKKQNKILKKDERKKVIFSRYERAFIRALKRAREGLCVSDQFSYMLQMQAASRYYDIKKYRNTQRYKDKSREYNKKYFGDDAKRKRNTQGYYIHLYDKSADLRKMSNEEITALYLKIKEENKKKRCENDIVSCEDVSGQTR